MVEGGGEDGRERKKEGPVSLSGFIGLGDEEEGEASVKIMVFINCFAFILYPLLTTFQQKTKTNKQQTKLNC